MAHLQRLISSILVLCMAVVIAACMPVSTPTPIVSPTNTSTPTVIGYTATVPPTGTSLVSSVTPTSTPTASATLTATQTPCSCPPTATPLVGHLILHALDEETGQAMLDVRLVFKPIWDFSNALTVTFVGLPVVLALTPGGYEVVESYPISYGSFFTNPNWLTISPEDQYVVYLYSRRVGPMPVNPSPTPKATPVVVTPQVVKPLVLPVYILPVRGMACPCPSGGRALWECASSCPEEEP